MKIGNDYNKRKIFYFYHLKLDIIMSISIDKYSIKKYDFNLSRC